MSVLTNILYWLSTGMLVPVILLLLFCFAWALALIGELYGQVARRLRARDSHRVLSDAARHGAIRNTPLAGMLPERSSLRNAITALEATGWHEVHGDKIICDHEAAGRRSIESAILLTRLGPMLGLMGTLIPMGPALVNLAAGDIASMAANIQVAFSTTVIGIFAGGVGFLVQVFKKRWAQADSELLRYLLELAVVERGCHATRKKDGEAA